MNCVFSFQLIPSVCTSLTILRYTVYRRESLDRLFCHRLVHFDYFHDSARLRRQSDSASQSAHFTWEILALGWTLDHQSGCSLKLGWGNGGWIFYQIGGLWLTHGSRQRLLTRHRLRFLNFTQAKDFHWLLLRVGGGVLDGWWFEGGLDWLVLEAIPVVEQVTIAVFHIIEVHFCFGSSELFWAVAAKRKNVMDWQKSKA